MVAVRWYWDEVKYPEVWESMPSCVFMCGTSVCAVAQRMVHKAAQRWPRSSAPHTSTSCFSQGSWDANLCLNATSAPSSLPGQSKPLYFITPEEGEGGNRSGSVSRWCGQVPTRLGWTIFSWCYPELGELPQEKSFLQRFFFYITS